jgi:hypothetical protein
MKKIILALIVCVYYFGAKAQSDSLKNELKVNFGIMLNPQGKMSLKNPDKGFEVVSPLFVILPIEQGNLSLTPIFQLDDNSIGWFVNYSFKKFGAYAVGIKDTKCLDLYLGIGGSVPVAEKRASMFIEFGSIQNKWDPQFFFGLSIPFTVK